MGQKVHPLGFRLVTTQTHKSIWYTEFKTYPELLSEDTAIRTLIEKKSKIAGIAKVEIKKYVAIPKITNVAPTLIAVFLDIPNIFFSDSCGVDCVDGVAVDPKT